MESRKPCLGTVIVFCSLVFVTWQIVFCRAFENSANAPISTGPDIAAKRRIKKSIKRRRNGIRTSTIRPEDNVDSNNIEASEEHSGEAPQASPEFSNLTGSIPSDSLESLANVISELDAEFESVNEADDVLQQDVVDESISNKEENKNERIQVSLFNFPPKPGKTHTAAEISLQNQLPLQQRLLKYFTDDKLFTVQVIGSLYFTLNSIFVAISNEGSITAVKAFQSALLALIVKYWCVVIQRLQRVLVPHLLYEPTRYAKFRARTLGLARDPSVQTIVYSGLMLSRRPYMKSALLPLAFREVAYLLMVLREVLTIVLPGILPSADSLFKWPLAIFVNNGDEKMWEKMVENERQIAIGRKVAQVCFKLEVLVMSLVLIKEFPRAMMADNKAVSSIIFFLFIGVFSRLLAIQNEQLQGDTRIFQGLKLGKVGLGWIEIVLDSYLYSYILGLPKSIAMVMSIFQVATPSRIKSLHSEIKNSDSPIRALAGRALRAVVKVEEISEESEENYEEKENSEQSAGTIAIALGLADT